MDDVAARNILILDTTNRIIENLGSDHVISVQGSHMGNTISLNVGDFYIVKYYFSAEEAEMKVNSYREGYRGGARLNTIVASIANPDFANDLYRAILADYKEMLDKVVLTAVNARDKIENLSSTLLLQE